MNKKLFAPGLLTLKVLFLMLTTIILESHGHSQITQTIRGTVIDVASKSPLPDVKVIVIDSVQNKGDITDVDGTFKIENVPVGRKLIEVRNYGYENKTLNINLTSGKELVLTIELEERIDVKEEVTIKGKRQGETNNEMANVSARSFSVEATKRYAGSVNDVARMAQNFAGVQGNDDSRNDIIIRGNSPIGVLYRFEGIDIPNPNHFALLGTAGGPVSILNNNVLDNSDFLTGAFPAEYGNALAGVFDLKMRKGNNQKHEFLGQIGFNGAELMAEGPINREKKSSYLVSYRYSTLQFFSMVGINFGAGVAVPDYQDLNFNFSFPNKKGSTSIFGIGGLSNVDFEGNNNSDENNLFTENNEDLTFRSKIGVVGIKNVFRINKKGYIKTTVSTSATHNGISRDSIMFPSLERFPTYRNNSLQGKNNLNTQLNYKFNAKHLLRVGVIADRLYFDLNDSIYQGNEEWMELTSFNGDAFILQPFAQWQYKLNPRWTANLGVHHQWFTLNDDQSLEPRASIEFKVNTKHRLAFGYGKHSQVPPMRIYFRQVQLMDGTLVRPNQQLEMTRAHHFVLSYDYRILPKLNLNVETYYQDLSNVPVDVNSNNYSLLNFGANFSNSFPDSLINAGSGTNRGVELTLEHYMHKGFYFLLNTSLYESLYTGSNGIQHGTNFNGNYTFNLLGGKEFFFKNKPKKEGKQRVHSLTIDLSLTLNGGQRYTPVDKSASQQTGQIIYETDRINELQYKDYFRTDLRIAYRLSTKNITQEFAVDIRNLLNYQNIFMKEFNVETGMYETTYQIGFLPIFQWRIEF